MYQYEGKISIFYGEIRDLSLQEMLMFISYSNHDRLSNAGLLFRLCFTRRNYHGLFRKKEMF